MVALVGIMCLVLLCGSILIIASFPISLYQKKRHIKKNVGEKAIDYYRYLFDVYDESTSYQNNSRK